MSNTLLITGGTGSLGHAIVEKLLQEKNTFEKIVIYSRDEQKQEQMAQKFKVFDLQNSLRFFIGDIRDKDRLRLAMHGVTHIIHAAALKIVPAIEYNPMECIKTNVLGAQNIIECAMEMPCPEKEKYVRGPGNIIKEIIKQPLKIMAISTDKAVSPINLYGASKMAAEKLFLAANNMRGPDGPVFSVARYGNVAMARGSVIPLFQKQIAETGKVTVTDPSMTRFWITLKDAAKFVLDRLFDMKGSEIYIPDMPAFSVGDLATVMSGEYSICGTRPGEKIHEELITKYEMPYIIDMNDNVVSIYNYFIIGKEKVADVNYMLASNGYNSNIDSIKMTKDQIKKELIVLGAIKEDRKIERHLTFGVTL